MLTTNRTSRFKKDFKRILVGRHGKDLDRLMEEVLDFLLTEKSLPPRYFDHSLAGRYVECRECHLKPDLLLIYRRLDKDTLQLTRLGSHSQLFKK